MRLWWSGTRRTRAGLAISLAAALVLSGCGGGGGGDAKASGGKPDPDATLRVMQGMAASLDPVEAPEPARLTFSTWPVYDRLLQVGLDSTYEPMLATKWEFSADGKTLNLDLREGVTFTDGEPFNAEAVKANLERGMAADQTQLQANLVSIASVEATGDLTVALKLKEPTTEILSALASNLGGIMISPKSLNADDLGSHPVGTGAYTIESFKPSQEAVYVRRTDKDGIWDPKTGKSAKVIIQAQPSLEARTNALKSGQIDWAGWEGLDSTYASEVASGKIVTKPFEGVLNLVGVYFNPKVKPLGDVKVRQAINLAIDRDAIVKAFAPVDEARTQPWPKGLPGFEESREGAYPYDVKKAKQLLAEAGYADGFTIPGEFLASTNSNIDKAAEAVQANLAEIGIKIKLRTVEILSQVTTWPAGKNPGQFMYMSLPSIDAYSWLQRLFVNPFWSPGGTSPELVKLTENTNHPELSEAELASKVGDAVEYATENAVFAPLWQGVGGYAASNKVGGLDTIASVNGGVPDLRNTWITK